MAFKIFSLAQLLLLAATAVAAPTSDAPTIHLLNKRQASSGFECHDMMIPIHLKQTAKKHYTLDNYDVKFVYDIEKFKLFRTGTYNVSAVFCGPPAGYSGTVKDTVQLLSHGGTFKKEMWDWPYKPETYNWQDKMHAAGYSTLAWDTIGCGASDHPDGLFDVQTQSAVETARMLSSWLRAGHFGGKKYKVAYVGFSIQSVAGISLVNQYPDSVDAVLLHGFTWNITNAYPGFLAGLQVPVNTVKDKPEWANYDGYYQSQPTPASREAVCFFGDYDRGLLPTDFRLRDMDCLGQALSFGYHLVAAPLYRGPFFLANGNQDSSYCGLECGSKPYAAYDYVPGASDIDIKVYDQAGHAIQLHKCAPKLHEDTIKFLERNNL